MSKEQTTALIKAAEIDARYGPPEARQIDMTKKNTFIRGALWWRNHGSKL